jgi:hypothetical protein
MRKRILSSLLHRLGPFGAAALLFILVGSPSALAGTGPNTIQNPGFESGTFAGWAGGGSFGAYANVVAGSAHSGTYSAVIGYPYRPANIDTVIAQYAFVPVIQPSLTFWIKTQCSSGFDWFRVQIRDVGVPGFSTQTLECTTSNVWVQRAIDMTQFAGRYVEIRFEVWSRGLGLMPTFTQLDDVSLT